MASVIKLKRSSTGGAVPSASDLEVGEVAINLADRVIYSKQSGGAVVRIGEASLGNTNAFITSVQTAERSALANTNTRLAALEGGSSGALSDRIDLVNTNLTATNTAIRALNTATQSALDTQEAKQASDLANTNAFIATVQASAGGGLGNTNLAIAQLNTNLLGTNTAIRALNTATQSALDTQEAKQASDLANTNVAIALLNTNLTATNTAIRALNTATQSALDTQEAKQASDLANTNTRINNLSSTLSGDFLTKANPESSGLFAHTGRMTVSTNLTVSGNTHIDGNLNVEGEVTYISTTTLEVMDPLIKLASNNQTDAVDTGFYALYDEGSTAKFSGIFRDATDGVFKVFKDLQADPGVTVDTSGTGYAQAQLDAIIDGGSF